MATFGAWLTDKRERKKHTQCDINAQLVHQNICTKREIRTINSCLVCDAQTKRTCCHEWKNETTNDANRKHNLPTLSLFFRMLRARFTSIKKQEVFSSQAKTRRQFVLFDKLLCLRVLAGKPIRKPLWMLSENASISKMRQKWKKKTIRNRKRRQRK